MLDLPPTERPSFYTKGQPHRDMVSEDIHVSDPTAKKKQANNTK